MKNYYIFFNLLLIFLAVNAQDSVLLQDKVISIKCSGISFIGSGITVDEAKAFAVNDAKRNALEQVGTYLESHTEISNYMVTKDDIETYTAGILKTEILSTENKVVEGTFAVEVKIMALIDTGSLNERLKKIKDDTELRKMLEEQKKLNDRLTKEIGMLKDQNISDPDKSRNLARSLEAGTFFDLGFKAQEKGLYEEALANYKKAIELNPKIAQTYNNRGLVYYQMKDFPKAESNFDKAIELDPKLTMAYNNKAIIYYERRLYEQAVKYFDMVIALDPKLEQPYFNRAFAYQKMNMTEECTNDLKTYLKLAGNKHGEENRIMNFIKDTETKKTKEPPPAEELVTVPGLYNTDPKAAAKIIRDSGLVLGITKSVTDDDKGFNRVIAQSLKKGDKVKKGSVIDITVNEEAASGW
jgi:tetratricopeptide (TPR) repeat protein